MYTNWPTDPNTWRIRQRVRTLIEMCGSRERYAIGSGSSIPGYIPVENYWAMVDKVLEV